MESIFNEIAREYICKNPDTLGKWIECNQGLFVMIIICIFAFFLGIAIILNKD